jgi:heptaprenyl diphosphate synthase
VREGVHTLPMLYALAETGADGARLRELLAGPVDDDAEVAEALTLLRASAGMARAKETLSEYAAKARHELALLPDVPGRHALEALVEYTISRHG